MCSRRQARNPIIIITHNEVFFRFGGHRLLTPPSLPPSLSSLLSPSCRLIILGPFIWILGHYCGAPIPLHLGITHQSFIYLFFATPSPPSLPCQMAFRKPNQNPPTGRNLSCRARNIIQFVWGSTKPPPSPYPFHPCIEAYFVGLAEGGSRIILAYCFEVLNPIPPPYHPLHQKLQKQMSSNRGRHWGGGARDAR